MRQVAVSNNGPSHIFINLATASNAKPNRPDNEDAFAVADTVLAVADGVTSKGPQALIDGRSAGGVVARLAVATAVATPSFGRDLIESVNREVSAFLRDRGIEPGPGGPACTLACVHIVGDELIVTRVGDTGVRLNGDPAPEREEMA